MLPMSSVKHAVNGCAKWVPDDWLHNLFGLCYSDTSPTAVACMDHDELSAWFLFFLKKAHTHMHAHTHTHTHTDTHTHKHARLYIYIYILNVVSAQI